MRHLLLILLFFILTTGCSYSYGQPVKKFIWTPISTQNTYGGIIDITWSSELNQYVAVGGSAILNSKDGINWKNYYPLKNSEITLFSVLWANNKYVAAGSEGYIFTSQDGISWNAATSDTKQNIRSIAWSGSKFVAVGDGGCFITSDDGDNWNTCDSPTKEDLSKIIWTGEKFVAVGIDGIIMSSINGLEWQIIRFPTGEFADAFSSIIYVNKEYLASSISGDIRISSDLINWATIYQAQNSLLNIFYANNTYFAIGRNTIDISKNGYVWEASLENNNEDNDMVFYGIAASDKNIIITGLYWNNKMPVILKTKI